ncbi:hypothetical protein CDL15_Pgr021241 [Punica granatum]|uniref:C2H2-type domain-containing protein n=2 Tax=Punica granatum TaxID=22663 RepID=A0A218WRA2_PUNGR|nr:hypothetical protein CDL15_Pgr021241 [Punica granatum]
MRRLNETNRLTWQLSLDYPSQNQLLSDLRFDGNVIDDDDLLEMEPPKLSLYLLFITPSAVHRDLFGLTVPVVGNSNAKSYNFLQYLTPFLEKERYQLSTNCRLHHENNLYRDQEQHKIHTDINEWKCGYCRKRFYEEKYLDKHFDNRHYDMLNTSHGRCLADLCGALHCDYVMDSTPKKSKCNPAAAARNGHLCESLADTCFPVNQGPSASRLHEFFLRQFCDAHTCSGSRKPFSRGRRKRRSAFYIVISILVLLLLPLFYIFIYLYQRGIRSGTQDLKRISRTTRKKKPS